MASPCCPPSGKVLFLFFSWMKSRRHCTLNEPRFTKKSLEKKISLISMRRWQRKGPDVFESCVIAEMCLAGLRGWAAIHKKSTEPSSECCSVLLHPRTPQLFSMEHICPALCCTRHAVKVMLLSKSAWKETTFMQFLMLKCFVLKVNWSSLCAIVY